jgi:predicted ATPase
LRFFSERFRNQALNLLDEPESALSPTRQLEFMKFLRRAGTRAGFQVIMATHSPLLMAYPGAQLLRLTRDGLEPIRLIETDHFRLLREFCEDPEGFVEREFDE